MKNLVRAEAIAKALGDYHARSDTRTLTLDFRGLPKSFEVVRAGIDVPLLNHDNSRLRAQLVTHPKRDVVLNDPESSEAQEILSDLLRRTEKYKELKTQLKELSQKNPGVISRDGMLVNGNTRLVALRDNGETGIDVAVLPAEANATDFFEVEMSLQMVNLIEQAYTFTNQILLVENLRSRFNTEEAIFRALNWQRNGPKRLAENLRWLALVEEIRVATGRPYEFFDDKREMIKDLDSSYQSVLAEGPRAAETLKWNRIISLVLGLSKDEIRVIDEDFILDRVATSLEGKPEASFLNQFTSNSDSSGLEELFGSNEDRNAPKLDGRDVVKGLLALDDEDPLRAGIYRDFKIGARELIDQQVKEQIRTQPLEYLEQVTGKIEELTLNLPEYFADSGFDKGNFTYKAKKLQKAMRELEATLAKQIEVDA